jgi:biopolymer transport protein ExbD
MAEMNDQPKRGKGGKKGKKQAPRVDLTPMVDLAFLLITFFMLATSMTRPQTMELAMPAKDDKITEEERTKVKASQAMTIILEEEDKVFYYFGTQEEGGPEPELQQTTYDPEGLRRVLLSRNATVMNKILELKEKKRNKELTEDDYKKLATEAKEDPAAPTVIIKPSDRCSYLNLVDVLDEMAICNVSKYTIVRLDHLDTTMMQKHLPAIYGTPSN